MIAEFNVLVRQELQERFEREPELRTSIGMHTALRFIQAAQNVAMTGEGDKTCRDAYPHVEYQDTWMKLFNGLNHESKSVLKDFAQAHRMQVFLSFDGEFSEDFFAVEILLYRNGNKGWFQKYGRIFNFADGT